MNGERAARGIVPACLIRGSTLGRIQHDVLVHVDEARRHRAARAIDYGRAGGVNGFGGNLLDVIVFDEHVHAHLQLGSESIEYVHVGEQKLFRRVLRDRRERHKQGRSRKYSP